MVQPNQPLKLYSILLQNYKFSMQAKPSISYGWLTKITIITRNLSILLFHIIKQISVHLFRLLGWQGYVSSTVGNVARMCQQAKIYCEFQTIYFTIFIG